LNEHGLLDADTLFLAERLTDPTVLPERQAGRKTAARRYDAMITATALAHKLPVFTCNPDDFQGIPGLTVVTVPIPGT
jgi:predicted nucleic acid-binding protein